ncbi:YdcF family protein [Candidatus Uhrbacteria bacterium]|nr:YdcF family protein [Candidatus Uhrbacteria bacterium]
MEEVDDLAKTIWDYMLMHQPLKKADCILSPGATDTRLAEYAADLFLRGYAPCIIFSGGFGRFSKHQFQKPEAEVFADIALKKGVPEENVLLETGATSTFENVIFTRRLLEEKRIQCHSLIVVHKPYMERRMYATMKHWWPEKEIVVTSPPISFEEYPNASISRELMINALVGDLQRIKIYPKKGWQIPQEIPENVWHAYEKLVALGYTQQLVNEEL